MDIKSTIEYGLSGSSGPSKNTSAPEDVWWKGKWDRKFLGKVKDFSSDEERDLEQRHLKAYIKGRKYFRDGTYRDIRNPLTGLIERQPNLVEVKQSLTKIK